MRDEEEDAKEKREDAAAIEATDVEDAAQTKLQDEEADAKHLNEVADRELKKAQTEEIEVKEEAEDAEAISFVSHDKKEGERATEEAEDAEALSLDANQEEQQVRKEEQDAKEKNEDAAAISATSLQEYRSEKDDESDAAHLEEVADHESKEAHKEEAEAEEELDDAQAISFVVQDKKDPVAQAREENEDAEALRLDANEEEKHAHQEEEDAKEMQEDAAAIKETEREELANPASFTSKTARKEVEDACVAGYPGATPVAKCSALVAHAEGILSKLLSSKGHQVFLQTADAPSCEELKAYKKELEETVKRCETSPTCWETTKKVVPGVIEKIDAEIAEKCK